MDNFHSWEWRNNLVTYQSVLHPKSQLDFDSNRVHPLVQATIRGSKKACTNLICRKLPLHLHYLASFMDTACQTKKYDNLLFATMMSCCFYACHRSGELVKEMAKKPIDWQKVSKQSSVNFTHRYAGYHSPYHKADPFYHGTDILFTHRETADPVSMLHKYTGIRDKLHRFCCALFCNFVGG
ncbi:hypothetical protein J132_08183 [Termitomyces sp. J132]|nr:hypothetical protein J132_08183 [Termitomyces sp. J132]